MIAPFINSIIENNHIEGMNKIFNIMSYYLTMAQKLQSDSVQSLDEDSLLNTETIFQILAIQGAHDLDY